ncbi:hypothetical protein [Parerythrobacter aestuarii]|uniref:hypothetical protein n=1 Tax=Parerythrobacter aestuarii TaxID=3020909 RepID=UPI0024DDFD28|nr:hypothetical protein [Parerythrobacter aestuarii]
MLEGLWTYRSFFNRYDRVDSDANAALALLFGEGLLKLTRLQTGNYTGGLSFGDGLDLNLECKILRDSDPFEFAWIGTGLAGKPTEGWRYDYRGYLSHQWPNAIDQVPALVGTVIRTLAHGDNAPAGVTASFIAVKHPERDDDDVSAPRAPSFLT